MTKNTTHISHPFTWTPPQHRFRICLIYIIHTPKITFTFIKNDEQNTLARWMPADVMLHTFGWMGARKSLVWRANIMVHIISGGWAYADNQQPGIACPGTRHCSREHSSYIGRNNDCDSSLAEMRHTDSVGHDQREPHRWMCGASYFDFHRVSMYTNGLNVQLIYYNQPPHRSHMHVRMFYIVARRRSSHRISAYSIYRVLYRPVRMDRFRVQAISGLGMGSPMGTLKSKASAIIMLTLVWLKCIGTE